MTLEEIVNSLKSAGQDYGQLFNNNPRMDTFASILQKGIGQLIPSNADFKSPEAMRDWGTAAALNAPMGLTFIGKNAANWNPVKAAEAEKLLNAGVDPAQVWKEHLIGRMPDKSLFSEIDDSGALYRPGKAVADYKQWRIDNLGTPYDPTEHAAMFNQSDILKHTDLYANYPDTGKIKIVSDPGKAQIGSGDYRKGDMGVDSIRINPETFRQLESGKSVNMHELQHAIQDREGWAMGGSPDTTLSDPLLKETIRLNLSDKLKSMDETVSNSALSDFGMNVSEMSPLQREIARTSLLKETRDGKTFQIPKNLTPYQLYRRLTGEAQARATQDRMNMNMQQRRDTYPLAGGKLSDIPLDQLINRYYK